LQGLSLREFEVGSYNVRWAGATVRKIGYSYKEEKSAMKMPASIGRWILFAVVFSAATVVLASHWKAIAAHENGRAMAVAAQCIIDEATQGIPCESKLRENFRKISAGYVARGSVPFNECVAFLEGFSQPWASVYSSTVTIDSALVKERLGNANLSACAGSNGTSVYEIRLPAQVGPESLALERLHQSVRSK
jgi:hypothetical protein